MLEHKILPVDDFTLMVCAFIDFSLRSYESAHAGLQPAPGFSAPMKNIIRNSGRMEAFFSPKAKKYFVQNGDCVPNRLFL
jgi:hypothetical protein